MNTRAMNTRNPGNSGWRGFGARALAAAAAAAALLAVGGCDIEITHGGKGGALHVGGVRGSGRLTTVQREVPAFQRIVNRGSVDMEIVLGTELTKVEVTGDDNLVKLVQLTVEGDALHVTTQGNYSTRNPLQVRVAVPKLLGIKSLGSADISVRGLAGETFEVDSQGSGDVSLSGRVASLQAKSRGSADIKMHDVMAETVNVEVHGSGNIAVRAEKSLQVRQFGSGDVDAEGSAGAVDVEIRGSGNFSGRRLNAKKARIDVAGSGDADIYVTEQLDAKVSGSGSITYYGDPKQMNREQRGSGEVTRG